ncbi:adenosylcobinamide-GDP ribazoletransferase [uncultured Jatrophihabitans sp.]|uniref:adenosylcobinamide-GDP ribazoletransferase n=1 Tax=uncultured Jatrophihabitans sp. TaxID=1610747 RepID=UPI0035CC8BEA
MKEAGPRGALLCAFGMFSVLPVPARFATPGPRVVRWLPVVGLVVGALAFAPALAVWRGGPHGAPLLAAALVLGTSAALTRGLHLDGLADLADGLGSGRVAGEALTIMRRSDVGALGVGTLVLVLLTQLAALAAVFGADSRPAALAAVLTAAVTGRVAVVLAARRGVAAAAGSSFGRLVAGSVGPGECGLAVVALLAAAAGGRWLAGGDLRCCLWSAGAVVVALGVAEALRRHATRRLGGVSGDVFGALVEVGATSVLLVLAVETVWR